MGVTTDIVIEIDLVIMDHVIVTDIVITDLIIAIVIIMDRDITTDIPIIIALIIVIIILDTIILGIVTTIRGTAIITGDVTIATIIAEGITTSVTIIDQPVGIVIGSL